MKTKLTLLAFLLLTGCARYQSFPTYSYRTLNKSTGTISTNASDVLYHKGDIVTQLPDGTKFEILEVRLTKSHYSSKNQLIGSNVSNLL